ncbi:DUF4365 domain-containing protein [Streptomyces sp. BH105]|uniref:DUF4365 domain-containing protein n=1 Tax=Streptomyces sp. BH105 TaxID=3410408 RepID=UPI003CF9FA35
MRSDEQEATGSVGAHRVMADFEDLGWGPVENSQHDLGIDLFLQVRDERRFDRTVLMAAQVKTGSSYFGNPQRDLAGEVTGWWYAESDARRFEDWVQHGLPHLLVLHDREARVSYWAHVTEGSVVPAGEGFKVLVPSSQRVEPAQLPELLEVAASAKTAWALEGSSWSASAAAVAPGRAVRHALIAPRLIAPHPNTGHERVLAPEEAIALVSQGRSSALDSYRKMTPELTKLADQKGWRWRLLHAYLQAVDEGDVSALLDLAAAEATRHAKHPYRRAAAAVVCAVFLADEERWAEAERVLAEAGDDLPPVDHAWVLVHRALLAGERGEMALARGLAADCQRAVILDSDDVTARAIAAAAASFLFESSVWDVRELEDAVTTGDTASSWWRSQSVAWALSDHDAKVFAAWGQGEEPGEEPAGGAGERLRGVWLQASFCGLRGAAAQPASQRACHAVMRHEVQWRSTTVESIADASAAALGQAVDVLRRYGSVKQLSAAVRRLRASGPAVCLSVPLQRSMDAGWRHSTARTKLLLWELAGDLLPGEQADTTASECLRILDDPGVLAQQVRPTFHVRRYVQAALGRVLSASSDSLHVATASYVLRELGQEAGIVEDVARLVAQLRPCAVASVVEQWRSAALGQAHAGLSAAMLALLAKAGDGEAQDALLRRARDGSIEALGFLPQADLGEPAVAALAVFAAEQCRTRLADARNNSWGFGGAGHHPAAGLVWSGVPRARRLGDRQRAPRRRQSGSRRQGRGHATAGAACS